MAIREQEYGEGTGLSWIGRLHSGMISIASNGFNIHKAVGQRELVELLPADCNKVDGRQGNIYKVSLTSSIANFDIEHPNVGTYIFIFEQDSTGGKTVAFPSNFYFISGLGTPDFSGDSAGTINIISFLCDGENFYGTYVQDFVNS